jgi:DNA-binding NarL/FixJ family response regulator
VLVDALDAHVAAGGLGIDEDWEGGLVEELATILPSLRSRRSEPASGGDERHRAHRAVRRLLELVAAATPVVLVLDDLHWADGASIEVIAALLRRRTSAPVMLGLGYRAGQAPAELVAALAAPGVTIIELAPLTLEDAARLVDSAPTPDQMRAIFLESGGNPFYTLQLARAAQLPARSRTGDRVAERAGVPRLVAAALLAELQRQTPASRALLNAAAIAGDPFDPDVAGQIAEQPPSRATRALDDLLAAGLVHATAVPRLFAFRHPVVRRAVYESAPGGWRLAAHARAAALLGARGASATVRAHHVEQSAVPGDRDAVALLLEAADANAPSAPAAAAHWYAGAARLIPDTDTDARFAVLVRLAAVARSVGDLERCRGSLLEAIELVPVADVAARVRLASACAACENFLGRHDDARRRLESAFAELSDQVSPAGVVALTDLASGAFFTEDVERMMRHARRAVETARVVEDAALLGASVAVMSHLAAIAGLTAEATRGAEEARVLMELSDARLAGHLGAVNRLGWAKLLIERFPAAILDMERGVAIARETGQGQYVPLMLGAQALSEMILGRLAVALELQQDAIETARLAANNYVTCSVLTTSCQVLMTAGDIEAARRAGLESVGIVEDLGPSRIASMARARLAVTLRDLGAPQADTDALVAPLGGWDMSRIAPFWRVGFHEALTRIEIRGGTTAEAQRFARCAEQAAAGLGLDLATAISQRAGAAILLAEGDADAAAQRAVTSASSADATGARVEAARSRVLAGRAFATAGDRTQAIGALRQAERALDECGAVRDGADARRELRHLGVRAEARPPKGPDSALASLSSRERDVANLIAEHKTNKQVAAELFLSEKTVESHLRNIFFKLSAGSRIEVARAVEQDKLHLAGA